MGSAVAPGPAGAGAESASRAFAAVAAAAHRQLHELDALLLELPGQKADAAAGRKAEAAGHTLLWLEAETRGVAARLRLLDAAATAAASAAATGAGGAGSPAAGAAQLIDGLQALLAPRLLQGGPQGDQVDLVTII